MSINRNNNILVFLILGWCLIILTSCQREDEIVPFNTLVTSADRSDISLQYRENRPTLFIISSRGEGAEYEGELLAPHSEPAAQVRQLDYSENIAVLLVGEYGLTTGHRINIERITRQGDKITINTEIVGPEPETVYVDALVAPYHLISIPKTESWGEMILFEFVISGEVAATATHFIP